MTASAGREVDANPLRGAALGSAQTRADAKDAGGQNLGNLVEPLGRGHQVGLEWDRHGLENGEAAEQVSLVYIRGGSTNCRVASDLTAGVLIIAVRT
jgi:hypothetical protein